MWSARGLRWLVWSVALLVLPVPYGGLEHGVVTTAWLATIALATAAVVVVEGGGAAAGIATIFGVQALVLAAILWLASLALVGLLVRALDQRRAAWTVAAVVAVMLACAPLRVYHSPIARTPGRTTLAGLWR